MTTVDIQSRIAAENQIASRSSISPVPSSPAASGQNAGPSFADVLSSASASMGITFSGHAQTRLASRQIKLSPADMGKLSSALDKAASKGARSSLVLMDSANSGRVGLVVSVPNRTVITAVDTQGLKENIFTNIDSAMLI